MYYGLSGDAYTESWNPGEALFESVGLPPESYHVFGMVTTGVYTIAVPVKQYCTAGTSANMLMTKQQAFGNVLVDAGVDYGTTYICEQCGVDELTTMLMGVSMGTLAGFGGSVRDVDLPYLKSNKPSGNVANLVDDGYNGGITLQTGGRQIDYNAYVKRLETIEVEYEVIRNDVTDISMISQNTGMPEWKITRIKDHIFFKEHILDSGVKRFDADPEIADAWYRLKEGTYNQNDIDLLNHEYFEFKYESYYKTDYRTAHNKTEESGRIWDPYKEDN